MCDSLAHHRFERLIAVNGHGGNIAALTVAVNHTMETTGRRVFLIQWWDLAADVLGEIEGPMISAEEAETSIALALGPARDRVRRPAATPTTAARRSGQRAFRGRHLANTA